MVADEITIVYGITFDFTVFGHANIKVIKGLEYRDMILEDKMPRFEMPLYVIPHDMYDDGREEFAIGIELGTISITRGRADPSKLGLHLDLDKIEAAKRDFETKRSMVGVQKLIDGIDRTPSILLIKNNCMCCS